MYENGKIYMGLADGARVELALNMCNRHGLIAGASGTGKTTPTVNLGIGLARPKAFPTRACRCSCATSRATSRASAPPA